MPDVPTNTVAVDPLNGQIVYVGNDLGVYVSIDGGLNFQPFSDGLLDATLVFDITVSPSNRKLRLATHGKGVFERDMLPVTVTGIAESHSPVIAVYPNPASDHLFVNPGISGSYNLSIYDVKGSKVQYVEMLSGETNITLNTLRTGVYFLEIKSGTKRSVVRFVKH